MGDSTSRSVDFKAFAHAGTDISIEMLPVAPGISLRLITFKHPEPHRMNILFIAGWVSLIEGWREVLLEMTKDFTVYYLETREKISSHIEGKVPFTVDAMGNDLVRAINLLDLSDQSYIFFGSSLGATTILDCSRFVCRKPVCLVLISPNAVFRVPLIWRMIVKSFYPPLYALIKPSVKWYLRTFRLDLDSDYEQYEKYCRALDAGDPAKLKPAVLALAKYEIWDILEEVPYPTLVIGASKDKLHEPENLKRIVKMLPNAGYIDLETNKKTHSREMVGEMRRFYQNCGKSDISG